MGARRPAPRPGHGHVQDRWPPGPARGAGRRRRPRAASTACAGRRRRLRRRAGPAPRWRRRGRRLSDGAEAAGRGAGPSSFPDPHLVRPGSAAPWNRSGRLGPPPHHRAPTCGPRWRRGEPQGPPAEVPTVELPALAGRPAAVLCALFDERRQAQVVLTRRSSRLRSHTSQVSFPGGRLDPGEARPGGGPARGQGGGRARPASHRRLRPALDRAHPGQSGPDRALCGRLAGSAVAAPQPGRGGAGFHGLAGRAVGPGCVPGGGVDLPGRDPNGDMHFFELIGDTVWGATARMLYELLDVVLADRSAGFALASSGRPSCAGLDRPADTGHRDRTGTVGRSDLSPVRNRRCWSGDHVQPLRRDARSRQVERSAPEPPVPRAPDPSRRAGPAGGRDRSPDSGPAQAASGAGRTGPGRADVTARPRVVRSRRRLLAPPRPRAG